MTDDLDVDRRPSPWTVHTWVMAVASIAYGGFAMLIIASAKPGLGAALTEVVALMGAGLLAALFGVATLALHLLGRRRHPLALAYGLTGLVAALIAAVTLAP